MGWSHDIKQLTFGITRFKFLMQQNAVDLEKGSVHASQIIRANQPMLVGDEPGDREQQQWSPGGRGVRRGGARSDPELPASAGADSAGRGGAARLVVGPAMRVRGLSASPLRPVEGAGVRRRAAHRPRRSIAGSVVADGHAATAVLRLIQRSRPAWRSACVAGLCRQGLYKTPPADGNSELSTLVNVLRALSLS